MIKCAIVCISYLIVASKAAKAPFIKPCKSSDSGCLLESGRIALPYLAAGLPQLGVPSADPLHLEDVRGDNGELKLGFRKLMVAGASKCKMTKLELKGERSYSMELECPITATGQYTMGGKLFVISAEGDGDFEIKTDKIRINVDFDLDEVDGADGLKYWKVANYEYSYEPIEKFYIKLDNLFNGDTKKAKPVLDILDQSWKELITEIGKPIIQEIIEEALNVVKKFFEAVPVNELALD